MFADTYTATGLNRLSIGALLLWTGLCAGSLAWNWEREEANAMELAQNTARANFLKDQAFRLWASEKGGVYVRLGGRTQPNPYLAHLPDRDVVTTDGVPLTLMNPAFMLREMMDFYSEFYGIRGRITGLKALNPNNLADPWEAAAIHAFEAGAKEVSAVENIGGKPYLRLMRPMIMTPDCMKCHAQLGYKVGDVRGGVGVAVPLDEYAGMARKAHQVNGTTHGVLWLLGMLGIATVSLRSRRHLRERQHALEELALAAQVFDNGLQGTLIADAEGKILRVNQMFTEITGFTAEEAIGNTPRLLKSEHQDEDFYRAMWRQLTTQGSWQGELWDRRKNGQSFAVWQNISSVRDEKGAIRYFIGMFQDITEQKVASERIHHLAHFDLLTGLPNRQLFNDRLQHALSRAARDDTILAVMFVDLDHFKKVNDSLGHYAGDQLLITTAARLSSCVREADTVARLGGDEFTLLIENVGQLNEIERLLERLQQKLREPVHLDQQELFVGASIGVALYPRDGSTAETLLRNADTAMYRAKSGGRGRSSFFDQAMSAETKRRLALENSLRYAVERQELVLHYQAQAAFGAPRITGFEALVRWESPKHGCVSPCDFIPMAEETALIIPIGRWVMHTACRQAVAWNPAPDGPGIAINVSAVQLLEPGFADEVAALLAETGLAPERLEIEITESAVITHLDQAIAALNQLRGLGIHIAVDDFGTGYSSLTYLKRLPVNRLKVDRSFVQGTPDDASDVALVSAIIAMAHSLGLSTVAEGVETEAQRQFLASLGCDHYQGYLLSRPLPSGEIPRFLAATAGQA